MNKIIFTLFFFGSVFACGLFTDAYILPKWLFAIFLLSLFTPVFLFNGANGIDRKFVSLVFSFVAVILTAMCFYAQVMCKGDAQNAPIATYDNVAGVVACLCPMLAYIIYGFGGKANAVKKVSVPLILFCILSLKSRTGILASFLPLMLYIFLNRDSMKKMDNKKKWRTLFYLVMLLFLITLGTEKLDSAKGRLLIWEVTIQMLPDALPFGFGYGGFEKNYMNYQADYFRHHTDSTYAMLADNTSTPFNEYLHLVIDYGLIGLSILVFLIILYVRWYNKCSSNRRYASLCSMLSIAILSMFSYPFLYPITWIMLVLNFLWIMPQNYWDLLNNYSRHIAICTLPIAFCVASYAAKRGIDEWKWRNYDDMSSIDRETNKSLKAELDASFSYNPYYNYSEALAKYEARDYNGALHNITVCEKYMADYDVQLLKVQCLLHLGKYKDTELLAEHTHYMCPNRFYPLYYLALGYYAENKKKEMQQIWKEIMEKETKVNSWDIMVIKYMAEKIYKEGRDCCIDSFIDIR